MNMAKGLVRACERLKSPGILQLFPITLEKAGGEFLRYCIDMYDTPNPLSRVQFLIKGRDVVRTARRCRSRCTLTTQRMSSTSNWPSAWPRRRESSLTPSWWMLHTPMCVTPFHSSSQLDKTTDGRGEHRHCSPLHQTLCSTRHLNGSRARSTRGRGGRSPRDLGRDADGPDQGGSLHEGVSRHSTQSLSVEC